MLTSEVVEMGTARTWVVCPQPEGVLHEEVKLLLKEVEKVTKLVVSRSKLQLGKTRWSERPLGSPRLTRRPHQKLGERQVEVLVKDRYQVVLVERS